MSEAWSTLEQTALALAVAENTLEFEHRDLHWGNILVERTEEAFIVGTLDGRRKVVETHGVRATIIDFTHSRIKKGTFEIFHVINENKDNHVFFIHCDFRKNYFHSFTHIFFEMLLYVL